MYQCFTELREFERFEWSEVQQDAICTGSETHDCFEPISLFYKIESASRATQPRTHPSHFALSLHTMLSLGSVGLGLVVCRRDHD